MNGFKTMSKMNFKLLLRNKGYVILLLLLPVISALMLKVEGLYDTGVKASEQSIMELNREDEKHNDVKNNKLVIKVYDCSKSELSDYIIKQLAKTESYQIFRFKSKPINIAEARKKALASSNGNVMDAVIYIPADFETVILNSEESNIIIFEATHDGRIELIRHNMNTFLQSIYRYSAATKYKKEAMLHLLKASESSESKKETVSIEVGDALNLTAKQQLQSACVGLSLTFLTISFLFSGVFIAATVIQERQNRVFNRILLSKTSMLNYGLVKVLMIVMTVFLQTVVSGIAIKLLIKTDFGIPYTSYLFLIFCLGLIFNLFSVVMGILINNVLTSNYVSFMVCIITPLLSGLYFSLDGVSEWWDRLSMLMPQRWVVKTSEMIMAEKSGAFNTFSLVVLSYLIIIMCVGYIGIKIKRKE